MKRILVIDNYDSFTYNLVHMLRELADGYDIDVYRNDKTDPDTAGMYTHVLLSPGPGLPSSAGIMPELIRRHAEQLSILGVCLGHQAIGEVFGARLSNLTEVYHGVTTRIQVVHPTPVFAEIPSEISVCRYHSWVVSPADLPACLRVTAKDDEGQIMAMEHTYLRVYGVQFHPESILTEYGAKMIENWLDT